MSGSAPTQYCELHGGHGIISSTGSLLSHIFGGGQPKPPADGSDNPVHCHRSNDDPNAALGPDGKPLPADAERRCRQKKKNPLQKVFGIFGGKKKDSDKPPKPPEKGDSP